MSLLSLGHLLHGQPMQRRFEAEPQFQATLLLLQEQIPKATGFYSTSAEKMDFTTDAPVSEMRVINTSDTALPEVQLLSNGRYHVMVSNAGGGYSRWNEYAVTRWREDSTCDNWGMFCYLRDLNSGQYWSTAHHPTLKEAKTYEAVFSQGRAEFRRLDNNIETHTEIIVSPEDDIEIRRVLITNRSSSKKEIEITSYAEVVLAHPAADASHSSYSNLFVQTEIIASQQAIICTRRPRSKEEPQPWMFHMMRINGGKINEVSFETDRNQFIGRGNTVVDPQVMNKPGNLSGSQGSVLDPIVSIRYTMTLDQDETITLDMVTGISLERSTTQALIDKYRDHHLRDRAFELSWTHSQVILRQINASEADAQLYGRLAGSVIYANPLLRANANIIKQNWRGQSALWSYSISGDIPVVLLFVSDADNISLAKQLIQARVYWKLKGLTVDLVILNEDQSGYRQVLQDQIQSLVSASTGIHTGNIQGSIIVRQSDQLSQEDRVLLQTVARIVIADTFGSLEEQMNKKNPAKKAVPILVPSQTELVVPENELTDRELIFSNKLGGFTPDGKEYIITTTKEQSTPAPWINVIANENFGTIISESGSSYTWAENAHEFRLSPWNNDAVSDLGGEAFYIRDEKTGSFWSPMPFPVRGKRPIFHVMVLAIVCLNMLKMASGPKRSCIQILKHP
jgi:cellobiose phosphorylase